jgi:hypothetical protein
MVAVTGAIVPPGKANRRSHMNIEMPMREELSDAELDGVNGGFSVKALVDAIKGWLIPIDSPRRD